MSHATLVEFVLNIIIAGDISFSFAENPAFVKLLRVCFPNLPPPSRHAVAARLMQDAAMAKDELKEYFTGLDAKVSLALDGWNSRNNRDFLGTVPSH